MKPNQPKPQAVMNVEKGETVAGMWASPLIPQIGTYKLVAKRKKDGTFEWAHFIHREDGSRKPLFRGEVESEEQLTVVLEAANKILGRTFGQTVQLKTAEFETRTKDGKKFDGPVQ